MKHVMVDLETLDSASTAAITSIGAVFFEPGKGLGPTFKVNVSSKSSQDAGLTIDASTVDWWFQQTPEARAHLYDPKPISLTDALKQFTEFLKANLSFEEPVCFLWGNGATFDNVILRYAYTKVGLACPWNFRYDSCFRTLKNQFDPEGLLYKSPTVAHDSLSDAIGQANHALAIFDSLKKVKVSDLVASVA